MNISEFIEELNEYNPDAEITTPYSETISLSFIGDNMKDAKIVFIEWSDYAEEDS